MIPLSLAEVRDLAPGRLEGDADAITGVSEFPNLTEKRIERPEMPEPSTVSNSDGGLPRRRYAEAFESLRDDADAQGDRPAVFLATLGPVAAHTARATFTANLLAAGGIEAINPGVTDDLRAAFDDSGAFVACLCGTDRDYDERAAEVAAELRAAGAAAVLLAGKPRETEGIDGYLYAGCDALAVLTELHATLGVKK